MTLRGLVLVLCVFSVASCGDDDGGTPSGTGVSGNATGGAGGSSGNGGSLCQPGCWATLAANCSNGPATQVGCEQDCQALASGPCGTQYRALQDCAVSKPITCSNAGLPTVQGCSAEQTAFVSCLN